MEDTREPVQLIILGNGFDLNVGLKSSYSHFFAWRYNQKGSIFYEVKQLQSGFIDNLGETSVTIWDFLFLYKTQQRQQEFKRWVDIEEAILHSLGNLNNLCGRTMEYLYFPGVNFDNNIETNTYAGIASILKIRYEETVTEIIRAIERNAAKSFTSEKTIVVNSRRGILPQDYPLSSVSRVLLKELYLFEKAFSEYLEIAIQDHSDYEKKAEDLLYRLMYIDDKTSIMKTNVLSFNYTEPFRKGRFALLFLLEYRHVHGSLNNNNIIFGIDGHKTDSLQTPGILDFTKTFRTLSIERKLSANSTFLGHDISHIKFFGHSLGDADYSYFQAIFDRADLYGGKTALVFYLHERWGDESETEYLSRKDRFQKRVTRLLSEYGKTLGNQDHGKNLMHKLILEDRLYIREI